MIKWKKIFVVVSNMMGHRLHNQTVEKICDRTLMPLYWVTVVTVDNDTVFVSTLDAKDADFTGFFRQRYLDC